MKNAVVILIATLFFLSSCKKEEPIVLIEDTPPVLARFRVNLEASEPNGAKITQGLNDPFRIDFILSDEGELREYASYFLVNNDEEKKFYVSREVDLLVTEISFGISFSDGFQKLFLENGEWYYLSDGDELHFYAYARDDTGNTTSINVVTTLTE